MNQINEKAEFFRGLGNHNRLSIVLYIREKGEVSVTDIVNSLKIKQPEVSHCLQILRNANVVTYSKDSKKHLYKLTDTFYSIVK